MIKQMERRFAFVAIFVISLVLFILLLTVNVVSVLGNINRVDESLYSIAGASDDVKFDIQNRDFKPFGGTKPDGPFISKEVNRSYEVVLNSDYELISTNAHRYPDVDSTVAYDYAIEAIESNREFGFVMEYRFIKVEDIDFTKVIFLDYSFERKSEERLLLISIAIYFIAVILVAVLVRIFLKPVMKPIQEAYVKQREFITDASHELKTPLTIISTNMQLIEMEKGTSKWTKSVNNQVERLKTLSDDLVTLSRMDEKKILIAMSNISLSDIVNDVVMGFEDAFEASGRSFEYSIEENIYIKGNYDALEKVMSVLLHNALKYSSIKGAISVTLSQKGKQVELVVANSVDFIEKGNHEEYFKRFYRGDKSRNSKKGGFGIGLAIAKSVIEEHKGKIVAISPDSERLIIKITLPMSKRLFSADTTI